ncbi:MAG TPA: DUF6519 domain-containing protein [Thermoanaerobaculia bacterium]|nr:DUF6519 domain-containing protein [Thermoanaerobaculia bacterium]
MKGDFTRWTFNPKNQFTRVLTQQGRVQLDADTNEQAAILLHSLRTLAEDLIGPGGAPPDPDGTPGSGFRLVAGDKYALLPGRYYVGGIPVENDGKQVEAAEGSLLPSLKDAGTYLLYLDVWERLVTYVQDDGIREVALGGVDTAARARPAWRVRSRKLDKPTSCVRVHRDWPSTLGEIRPENRGLLQAQARRNDAKEDDPCIVSPAARYSGENQLYRVEIHQGGTAADGATFKWSRENGSVVFPVADRKSLTLEHLGRDGRLDLEKGDWVEALDDATDLLDEPRALLQVTTVDADRSRVTLSGTADLDGQHPFLRRWDQRERKKDDLKQGAVPIQEGQSFELEEGVNIRFVPAANGPAHRYRSGDYWLIPARTATGDVEWPQEPGKPGETAQPQSLPPHGVEHRYAPLGIVTLEKEGGPRAVQDCRTTFGAWARAIDTGAADWDFVGPAGRRPAAVVQPMIPAWSQALLPAAWISTSPGANEGPGPFTFELAFPLSSRQALLSFKLLADNAAQVLLNGRDLVTHKRAKNEGFKGEPTVYETDDPALFVSGTNTLTVVVTNTGTGTSPMGFVLSGRVDTGRGCCC